MSNYDSVRGVIGHEHYCIYEMVKERVVPPDRQNIGTIMRELHMKKYSEFPILEYTSGRCCMDDFYLEEIK